MVVDTIQLNPVTVNLSNALLDGLKTYTEVDFTKLRFSDGFYTGLTWDRIIQLVDGWEGTHNFRIELSPEQDEVWIMDADKAVFWAKR